MKSYKKKKEETIFLKEINGLLMSSKEIEKNYFLSQSQNNINTKDENEKNNLSENKKLLERKMRSLKYILKILEKNYGFNSPYHNEFKEQINSKENENITQEISNISEEKNFDMLKYLNKVRDRYNARVNLITKIKERDENSKSNIDNQNQSHYSNININNSNSQNNSSISNSELYNLKLSENEKILQKLKRQVNYFKNGKK